MDAPRRSASGPQALRMALWALCSAPRRSAALRGPAALRGTSLQSAHSTRVLWCSTGFCKLRGTPPCFVDSVVLRKCSVTLRGAL
eukprot:gene11858-biopygen7851